MQYKVVTNVSNKEDFFLIFDTLGHEADDGISGPSQTFAIVIWKGT